MTRHAMIDTPNGRPCDLCNREHQEKGMNICFVCRVLLLMGLDVPLGKRGKRWARSDTQNAAKA
jgi:hypothetical protein